MVKRSWIIPVILVFLLSACSPSVTRSPSFEGLPAATSAAAAPAPRSLADQSAAGNRPVDRPGSEYISRCSAPGGHECIPINCRS